MPQMQFDWDGLLKLLAENLYSEKRIFIRELVQNAHDAIRRRDNDLVHGRIDIEVDESRCTLTVTDNGIGMSDVDLRDFISTIGVGATRLTQGVPGLVGYFGIGFLSAFIVAESVQVTTRKDGEETTWRWINQGCRDYVIESVSGDGPVGTQVQVSLSPTQVGLLSRKEIAAVVEHYCDMLQVPIYFNRENQALNRQVMPWERKYHDEQSSLLQNKIYISERLREDAIEVIPIRHEGASGILYITNTRVLGVNTPQTVELYLNRMLVNTNVPDLLPEWASFVSGVINSSTLRPTAARDNVVRNDDFKSTRDLLGDLIVHHLERLRSESPERFSRILKFHSLGIKAACLHYETFFDKFIDLLEWRTNAPPQTSGDRLGTRLRTLPEIIKIVEGGSAPGELVAVRCFGSENAANHFFAMADATRSLVIDASLSFELQLLDRYVKRGTHLRLIRIDKDDDPVFFKPVLEQEEANILSLAAVMSQQTYMGPKGRARRQNVVVRRFEPSSLAAVIRPGANSDKIEEAQRILEDPSSTQTIRGMAETLIENVGSELTLAINASNPLIKRLAVQDHSDPEIRRLMLGIYNSAFLSSSLMSAYNAEVLHKDLTHFLSQALDGLASRKAHEKYAQPVRVRLRARSHLVFFMITPFATKYHPILEAVRTVVEDRWGAELMIASDLKYEDRILDNVQRHIEQADGFFVEVSEGNPNVMFELGVIFHQREARAMVQLASAEMQDRSDRRPELPADLAGMIYVDYSNKHNDALAGLIDAEARKDPQLTAILSRPNRELFVSGRKLHSRLNPLLPLNVCETLSREVATAQGWKDIQLDAFTDMLPAGYKDIGDRILQRINSSSL